MPWLCVQEVPTPEGELIKMSNPKTVAHTWCEVAAKRSFAEHDAEKALGRAKAKRRGQRGGKIENRAYYCSACDGFHLTQMSKRQHYSITDELAALVAA